MTQAQAGLPAPRRLPLQRRLFGGTGQTCRIYCQPGRPCTPPCAASRCSNCGYGNRPSPTSRPTLTTGAPTTQRPTRVPTPRPTAHSTASPTADCSDTSTMESSCTGAASGKLVPDKCNTACGRMFNAWWKRCSSSNFVVSLPGAPLPDLIRIALVLCRYAETELRSSITPSHMLMSQFPTKQSWCIFQSFVSLPLVSVNCEFVMR